MRFQYAGVRRDGVPFQGWCSDIALALFVERRFRVRDRQLVVMVDGVEVGGIGPSPDTGVRTWWAESEEES